MSVDRDTYQELGLPGKLSRFKHNREDRYNIRIDLLNEKFYPGKKFYQRVMWCFVGRIKPVTLLASWIIDGKCQEIPMPATTSGDICNWKKVGYKTSTYEFKNILIPNINDQTFGPYFSKQRKKRKREKMIPLNKEELEQTQTEEILSEVFDWFGLISLRLMRFLSEEKQEQQEQKQSTDIFFETSGQGAPIADVDPIEAAIHSWRNRITLPESTEKEKEEEDFTGLNIGSDQGENIEHLERDEKNMNKIEPLTDRVLEYNKGNGMSITISGFINSATILNLTEIARKMIVNGELPWIGIMVWGSRDVPVSFDESEHDVLWSGENDYIILLTKENTRLVYAALGQLDQYS